MFRISQDQGVIKQHLTTITYNYSTVSVQYTHTVQVKYAAKH
jgi:hypothetical protein